MGFLPFLLYIYATLNFFHFSVSAVISHPHKQTQSFLNSAKSAKDKAIELNIPADRKNLELVCPQ